MSKTFEITGKVARVSITEQISDKFRKRELRIIIDDDTDYPQTVPIEFTQNKTELLDSVTEGDEVTVSFNLRGREWNDRCFGSLQGWRLDIAAKSGDSSATDTESDSFDDGDDIPF